MTCEEISSDSDDTIPNVGTINIVGKAIRIWEMIMGKQIDRYLQCVLSFGNLHLKCGSIQLALLIGNKFSLHAKGSISLFSSSDLIVFVAESVLQTMCLVGKMAST